MALGHFGKRKFLLTPKIVDFRRVRAICSNIGQSFAADRQYSFGISTTIAAFCKFRHDFHQYHGQEDQGASEIAE
jgi:hypothetical protein